MADELLRRLKNRLKWNAIVTFVRFRNRVDRIDKPNQKNKAAIEDYVLRQTGHEIETFNQTRLIFLALKNFMGTFLATSLSGATSFVNDYRSSADLLSLL